METIQALRALKSLNELAHFLGYTPSGFAFIVYKMPQASRYRCFEIPKKTGGTRKILAPCPQLKGLQRALSNILQDCLAELEDAKQLTHKSIAHGFKRKYSVATNASKHRNRRYVLNLDIKDFFGQINFGRVRGFFLANRDFCLDKTIATLLAQIACHDNCLPQGSPCSPIISNLLAHTLDIRLAKLAGRNHARYTRYADDLTFSTNTAGFPIDLATRDEFDKHRWQAGAKLRKEIERFDFSVNDSKTRMQYERSRQEVTGLVANKRVNVRSEYRRAARAMAHKLFETGSYYLPAKKDAVGKLEGTLASLRGTFSFIDYIDRHSMIRLDDEEIQKASTRKYEKSSQTALYRDLIFFSDFYAATKPVVIFEGKTDHIYFRCAIEAFAHNYPSLAEASPAGALTLKIRMHKGTGVAKRFFHLDSGTPGLKQFIVEYSDYWNRFSAPASQSPVIIVVDCDKGLNDVAGALKRYGKKIEPTNQFLWVCHNLYVVFLPPGKAAEDLFTPDLLKKELSGKTFNPSNKNISDTEYGKAYFAQHVVLPEKKKIKFDGFLPVLDAISSAIESNKSAAPP